MYQSLLLGHYALQLARQGLTTYITVCMVLCSMKAQASLSSVAAAAYLSSHSYRTLPSRGKVSYGKSNDGREITSLIGR